MPEARDGHTGVVFEGRFYVFGGDRHHMTFNDTFVFDLQAELDEKKITIV